MARGALTRMADVVRAEVDDFLTRLEDPKKMVRQMVLDMEGALDDAVAAVGRAVANEKMLEKKLAVKKEAVDVWQNKAETAMEAGEEELARKALHQKVVVFEEVTALTQSLEEAREVSITLKKQLTELKAKLESAKTRQGALIIRKGNAALRSDMHHCTGIRDAEAFARYDKFCQDVAHEEVVAEVYAEVTGANNPELDEAFDQLEQKKKVDAEILALKSKFKKQS
jgi:phage shock protein A